MQLFIICINGKWFDWPFQGLPSVCVCWKCSMNFLRSLVAQSLWETNALQIDTEIDIYNNYSQCNTFETNFPLCFHQFAGGSDSNKGKSKKWRKILQFPHISQCIHLKDKLGKLTHELTNHPNHRLSIFYRHKLWLRDRPTAHWS